MTWPAALRASIVAIGMESAMTNQANSARWLPLNQALNGEPVRIRPGTTVVTAPRAALLNSKFFVGATDGRLFERLWDNTDATDRRIAARVLDGDFTWLEDGVLDQSEGTGPWIASWAPGPSEHETVHRHYR